MNREKHTITDQQLDQLLEKAHHRQWIGPDHSPKVDHYLHSKGNTMKTQSNRYMSQSAMILLGIGVLAGGSLAAVVTQAIMNRHATIVTDDGTEYDVELDVTLDGTAGSFVADDGTAFDIKQDADLITVDVNSPTGGTSTVILDNGISPSITTEPGQTGSIKIGSPDDEKPAESDD